jgi:hypothetical protein
MSRARQASEVSRRKESHRKQRLPRTELLEPRLTLSASNLLGHWYTLLASGGSGARAASSTTLAPTADAAVEAGAYANVNYGQAPLLAAGCSSQANSNYQSCLKFDLGGASGTVSSAILNLTPLQSAGNLSKLTLRIQLLSDSADGWLESGASSRSSAGALTWSNCPGGSGLTMSVPGTSLRLGSTLSLDVTSLVNQNFNANHVASFVISATSSSSQTSDVFFASREYVNSSYRPSLRLTLGPPAPTPAAPTVATAASASPSTVTGKTTSLSVRGGSTSGESTLTYTWSTASEPSGAAAPVFSANGTNAAKATGVTFAAAGKYTFRVTISDGLGQTATSTVGVTVSQTLTSLSVTPATVTLAGGAKQQFAALGLDQFGAAMSSPTAVTWTASAGTVTSGGLFTAPASGTVTVKAACGSLTSTATVTVGSSFLNLQNADIAALAQSLFSGDGSISRADMLQIFTRVINDGSTVTTSQLHDMQVIVGAAATLKMPNYVQVLAADVVNGNTANAHYQGAALGNLAAGNATSKLTKLVNKWFYGTDHPLATGYTFKATTGSLFGSGPQYTDLYQGYLGDCYYLSTLGSIAQHAPAAIQNMFIANGDNTWTVRFYAGGAADYVTVDNQLPTYGGQLIFAGLGPQGKLWVALAEKAYAQWNETGKEGRDGQNNYASIEGGWMDVVNTQVLNHAATDYNVATTSDRNAMIAALAANKAVTIGTINLPSDPYDGLYGDHAYNVVSYNASTGMFTLYNPWGIDQPGPLSWTQLTQDCDVFTVADPSGTTPAGLAAAVKLSLRAGAGGRTGSAATTTSQAAAYDAAVVARGASCPRPETPAPIPSGDGQLVAASAALRDRWTTGHSAKLAAPAVDHLLADGALLTA